MEKTYPFMAKGLYYMVAVLWLLITCGIGFPISIIFIYMAKNAKIILTDTEMIYCMLGKTHIPYQNIERLEILQVNGVSMASVFEKNAASIARVHLIPLQIHYNNGKKKRLSIDKFNYFLDILDTLQKKTNLQLIIH